MSRDNPLHRARLERGLDVAEVARRTCLSPHVAHKIDAGRFEELPRGVYARSYVRAFASAVDLDPGAAIAAVGDRLPPAEDPLPQLRDVVRRSTPAWVRTLEGWAAPARALVAAATNRIAGAPDSGAGGPAETTARGVPDGEATGAAGLRRRFDELRGHFGSAAHRRVSAWRMSGEARTEQLAMHAKRAAAVAVDGALLVLLYGLLAWLTAVISGVTAAVVLRAAGLGVAIVWAVLVLQYVVLLGGVGGRTPGAWAFRLRRQVRARQTTPLGLREILGRTMLY